jgi:hypothetical protein
LVPYVVGPCAQSAPITAKPALRPSHKVVRATFARSAERADHRAAGAKTLCCGSNSRRWTLSGLHTCEILRLARIVAPWRQRRTRASSAPRPAGVSVDGNCPMESGCWSGGALRAGADRGRLHPRGRGCRDGWNTLAGSHCFARGLATSAAGARFLTLYRRFGQGRDAALPLFFVHWSLPRGRRDSGAEDLPDPNRRAVRREL